ncbi:hypothetical protein B0H13DRAFT_2313889 [Mycena leptocephala]|nr:hypothetical protein B0H13DRAFT_2313889 [Mycena leptocephala]
MSHATRLIALVCRPSPSPPALAMTRPLTYASSDNDWTATTTLDWCCPSPVIWFSIVMHRVVALLARTTYRGQHALCTISHTGAHASTIRVAIPTRSTPCGHAPSPMLPPFPSPPSTLLTPPPDVQGKRHKQPALLQHHRALPLALANPLHERSRWAFWKAPKTSMTTLHNATAIRSRHTARKLALAVGPQLHSPPPARPRDRPTSLCVASVPAARTAHTVSTPHPPRSFRLSHSRPLLTLTRGGVTSTASARSTVPASARPDFGSCGVICLTPPPGQAYTTPTSTSLSAPPADEYRKDEHKAAASPALPPQLSSASRRLRRLPFTVVSGGASTPQSRLRTRAPGLFPWHGNHPAAA